MEVYSVNLSVQNYQSKINYNTNFKQSNPALKKLAGQIASKEGLGLTVSPKLIDEICKKFGKNTLLFRDNNNINGLELICCGTSSPEVIEKLYDLFGRDAFIARPDKNKMNALGLTCRYNNSPSVIEKLFQLLGRDAFLERPAQNIMNALERACTDTKSPEIIDKLYELLGRDAFFARACSYSMNVIELACYHNKSPEVRKRFFELFGDEARVNSQNIGSDICRFRFFNNANSVPPQKIDKNSI